MTELSLHKLQAALNAKQYFQVALEIEAIFLLLRQCDFFSRDLDPTSTAFHGQDFLTQVAKALSLLFTTAEYPLTEPMFLGWLCFCREIQAIFSLSDYHNTEFLLSQWLEQLTPLLRPNTHSDAAVVKNQLQQLVMKMLLFYSFDNPTELELSLLSEVFPHLIPPSVFGLLSSPVVHTQKGHVKREAILEKPILVEKFQIKYTIVLYNLCIAWMMSTYSANSDKHKIKSIINHNIRHWLAQKKIPISRVTSQNAVGKRKVKSKLKLLICLESFATSHAMERAFAPIINELSNQFELIALMLNDMDRDNANQQLFGKISNASIIMPDVLADNMVFKNYINKIAKINADILYYPSIGMHELGVILANLRFAPIQIMGLGHPSSSFSPAIDYCIAEESVAFETDQGFSEKLIILPDQSQPSLPLACTQHVTQKPNRDFSTINIAVSATVGKINYRFLQACQAIAARAGRDIQFYFFVYHQELFSLQSKKHILSVMPEAKVYSKLNPEEYLERLSRCHLCLSTFPFSGSNSVVDALCLGLPVMCLTGNDPANRAAAAYVKVLDLPDYLISRSEQDYIVNTLRLIQNDEQRIALSDLILQRSAEKLIPESNPNYFSNTGNLALAMSLLYQNHQVIQHSEKRRYTLAELTALNTLQ